MRAIVIANGDISNYTYIKSNIKSDDYVICADGAIRHCIEMNIIPNLWIGDFDSCHFDAYIEKYPFLSSVETLKLSTEKDVTDTHAACDCAIQKNYNEILLLGALGTRFDHTMSNIHLLEYLLKSNVSACIVNEKNTLKIFDSFIKINSGKKYISLIPIDADVFVKKTTGFKYPLENFVLSRSVSLGVSNEILAKEATVEIDGGLLLAIESND